MGKNTLKYVPIVASRLRHCLPPSRVSSGALLLLRLAAPLYQRFVLNCTSVKIKNLEMLLEVWRNFKEKRIRMIIAFRHPYGDEPQLFGYILGSKLTPRLHVRFVHGYEVALWGGALIRWVLPRTGAVPVYHIKFDSSGIKNIRAIIRDDECPLALAPEGQVSYRSETVPRLEQGTAQLGFWCAEEIRKASRTERVVILPLSVHYRYDRRDTKKLLAMVGKLEGSCGMGSSFLPGLSLKERLDALDLRVLAMTEEFYGTTYGYQPPGLSGGEKDPRQLRWNALMEAALDHAETALGITVKEGAVTDMINRVYRIRQECWDRIYPEKKSGDECAFQAALADRRAGEAWYAMRHMEFVDIAFYLDSEYILGSHSADGGLSFDRLVETAYNLDDLVSRLSGGNITNRKNVMRKKALIIPGPVLDIGARLDDYQKDRKKALECATSDLNLIFLNCIKESFKE